MKKEIINKKSKDPMAHFNAPPLCINKKLINKEIIDYF